MSSELEDLQRQLREAEERAHNERREAERAHNQFREAEERAHNERRLREEAERQYQNTTLPEFLDACHTYLQLNLRVRKITEATKGDPANAVNKPRPNRIRQWENFEEQQAKIWDELMNSSFVREQHFNPRHVLKQMGLDIWRQKIGSELDLHIFARSAVQNPVSQIFEEVYADEVLRKLFKLKGSVKFENHSNMLSADRAEEVPPPNIPDTPRRSLRLQSNASNANPGSSSQTANPVPTLQVPRPRADQFCVYNTSSDDGGGRQQVAALISEYKAPHKLTLGHISEGLDEMDLDEVVDVGKNESVAIRCRRLMAAVITQGFSYMVQAGLEYGEIYTGEATIFLRIPDDPSTVYYYLSVPKSDVGAQTDWSESSDQPNRLHLTAIGQAVPFTLRALQTPPRSAKWKRDALRQLKTWNIVITEVEHAVKEMPSSEYKPPSWITRQNNRQSPIRFRPRKTTTIATCAIATSSSSSNDYDDPDTPSRPLPQPPTSSASRTSAQSPTEDNEQGEQEGTGGGYSKHSQRDLGPFCTPQCLLGIIQGGRLDQMCPNVKEHGQGCHQLNQVSFMRQIQHLLCDQLDYTEEMYIHGARGALFKIKLPGFGYTVVAKATGVECVGDLIHESAIYRRLLPIQGKYIPVHLGECTVDTILYYAGAVRIVYMMLLSWGGSPVRPPIPHSLVEEAIQGLQAIHQLGVLQEDPAARNILVHPERPGITWIDFERAILVAPQMTLGSKLSLKKKQKLEMQGYLEKSNNAFTQEVDRARAELIGDLE
ncbi:hypothetical protein B7494_g5705 [Chlorociboria aeruginascens]|nr:hypothetical protein B7494_g5705 [Chlorociboria aeruginascens]